MARTANRFTKGFGAYRCRSCNRRTRDTGQGDNEQLTLCVECFYLAGLENQLSDDPESFTMADCRTIAGAILAIEAKGGNASDWRSTFLGKDAFQVGLK